jgi:hypothetical protein
MISMVKRNASPIIPALNSTSFGAAFGLFDVIFNFLSGHSCYNLCLSRPVSRTVS